MLRNQNDINMKQMKGAFGNSQYKLFQKIEILQYFKLGSCNKYGPFNKLLKQIVLCLTLISTNTVETMI